MNEFITWEMLGDFVKLTGIVFATTQFTKNLPVIRKIKTMYWAWVIAFLLITITNVNAHNFNWIDLILYGISAIYITLSASGIHDGGNKNKAIKKEGEK